MDHQLPGPSKIRKRATKACLACRARKVRCDVSQRGRPCMNCYLDGESCVVIGRASRRRKSKDGGDNDAGAAADDGHTQGRDSGDVDPPLAHSASADGDVLMDTPSDGGSERLQVEVLRDAGHGLPAVHPTTNGGGGGGGGGSGGAGWRTAAAQARDMGSYGGASAQQYYSSQHDPAPLHQQQQQNSSARARHQQLKWAGEQSMVFGSDIAYTYYPFLTLDDLPAVPPQDVSYLEMQGCLRVPVRTILDEFVKQYFLHVHPIMPLLDESEVWEMYTSPSVGTTSSEHLSLLVWQAMLFAACNYVPRNTLRALGFVDVRAARAAFHRRAKLLFDFDVESSPVATAQAALLLSSWHPDPARNRTRTSSSWLSIAIEQATLAGAHRSTRPRDGPAMPNTALQAHAKPTLQRLWWCVLLHDRIASLCARRPLQVTRARFDHDVREGGVPVEPAAMAGERNGSKVYNIETKTSLLGGVFPELLRLAGALTDLLALVEAQDGMPQWSRRYGPEARARVEECKSQLLTWYRVASVNARPPEGRRSGRRDGDDGREEEFTHDSVVLYTDLMYLLYHSAMARLCHFECFGLIASTRWEGFDGASASDRAMMRQNHRDMQRATSGVITCLRDLAQHRLLRWLPPIVIGCISLPLALSIIDAKLSTQPDAKLHDLRRLDELLRAYQPHQDTPDWASDALRAMLDHAQLDEPHRHATITADWNEAQDVHPSTYLRLGLGQDATTRSNAAATTSASQSLARLLPHLFATSSLARTHSMLKSQGQPQAQTYAQTHHTATSPASSFSRSPAGGSQAPPSARDDSSLHHHNSHQHQHQQQQQQQQQNQQQMMLAEWMSQDQAISYSMQLGIAPPDLAAGEDGARLSAQAPTVPAATSGKTAYGEAQPAAVGALREATTAAAADWEETMAWAFSEAGDQAEGRLLEALVYRDQPHLIGGSVIPESPPQRYQHQQQQHQHQHQQLPQSQLVTAQPRRFSNKNNNNNNSTTAEGDVSKTRREEPEVFRGGRDEGEREMMTTGRAFWSAVGAWEQISGGRHG